LGYIIEKVTKEPYEQVVRKRIFKPLGMNNSGFNFSGLTNERKAKGYFTLTSKTPIASPVVDSTIAYAAGAIYSTVEDLYKWERAISSNKILSPAAWKSVFTPYMSKYGYGWLIDTLYGKEIMAHGGGIHGFASYLLRIPEEDVVVILLDNSSSELLERISFSVAALVLNQSYTIPQPKKEITIDTTILRQYVGEYQLTPNFSIVIRQKGSSMEAQATGQSPFDIFAEKENLFFLKAVEAKIEFIRDEKGNVSELILHQGGMKQRAKKIK
jgi:CubicO group peptidase (beta-lactamase class C family)